MKVFVVYHGAKPLSKFWANLATDKHHVLKLNGNIDGSVDDFLNLSCKDSRLYCDIDMYWNGTGCFRCSFICSPIPSEYCQIECPYFNQVAQDIQKSTGLTDLHAYVCDNTTVITFGLLKESEKGRKWYTERSNNTGRCYLCFRKIQHALLSSIHAV
ncbi:uncharacterized protein LOC128552172 [Mercenaria mercenaria]|uniref:uncharacterized protein LOC128552172 n=1 Tax=Mercenaria mercenaria TaxID=6596 RepID=UPI00234F3D54|nr:uncharacterized protein LOC128552172 [Mercenaria mercenaria]